MKNQLKLRRSTCCSSGWIFLCLDFEWYCEIQAVTLTQHPERGLFYACSVRMSILSLGYHIICFHMLQTRVGCYVSPVDTQHSQLLSFFFLAALLPSPHRTNRKRCLVTRLPTPVAFMLQDCWSTLVLVCQGVPGTPVLVLRQDSQVVGLLAPLLLTWDVKQLSLSAHFLFYF